MEFFSDFGPRWLESMRRERDHVLMGRTVDSAVHAGAVVLFNTIAVT